MTELYVDSRSPEQVLPKAEMCITEEDDSDSLSVDENDALQSTGEPSDHEDDDDDENDEGNFDDLDDNNDEDEDESDEPMKLG